MRLYKRILVLSTVFFFLFCPAAFASDMSYHFDGTHQEFGIQTSTEERVLETAETQNHNRSKTAAYIPPVFGSMTSYTLDHLERLTPNLVEESVLKDTTGIRQLEDAVMEVLPDSNTGTNSFWSACIQESWMTDVTQDMYYDAGHIGRLSIPALDVSVKVYEGATTGNMKQGIAHMEESSIWDGNVVLCGHNRGASSYFSKIYTLKAGDTIRYTTKLGEKVYEVVRVQKVQETNQDVLKPCMEDRLTLLTCVRNESAYRYAITAVRIQ